MDITGHRDWLQLKPATPLELVGKLNSAGEFLIFANSASHFAPTLAVGGSVNMTTIPFAQGVGDYFFIKEADLALKCTTIETLINCYVNYKIPVKISEEESTFLVYPVDNKARDDHLLLEEGNEVSQWTYYHGSSLEVEECENLLLRNGDYLLTSASREKVTFTFQVRWANKIHGVSFDQDGPVGTYKLRADHYYTPQETVPTLDCLVKTLARSKATSTGYQFIKPVRREAYLSKPRRMAPLPLNLVPFYHGKLSGRVASMRTTNAGDYLVYKTKTDQLKLVVKQVGKREKFYYHYDIRQDKNYHFFIRYNDTRRCFGTVYELIEYYREEKIMLSGNKDSAGKVYSVTLVNPVNKDKEPIIEEVYDHGEIDRDVSLFRLLQNGDFLIRTIPSTDEKVVTVRWNDDVHDLQPKDSERERYFLPKCEEGEPAEWVFSLREFLETVVTHNLQLGDICLKRAISPK